MINYAVMDYEYGDHITSVDILEINDTTWEQTIEKSKKPVVVMFSSPTCPYCRTIEPHFITYAKEFKGDIAFARINVMENQFTTERYGIMSTPTFKFFCKGHPVNELVGAIYPPLLKKTIEDSLQHGPECVDKSTMIDFLIGNIA